MSIFGPDTISDSDPFLSGQIGVPSDNSMNATQLSLAALNDLTANILLIGDDPISISISGPDTVSDPSSSRKISVPSDDSTNAIQLSLVALNDLAANIPLFGTVAKLLRRALKMRNEMRQSKVECGRVTKKLVNVANIVIEFGKKCEKHNLKERDLPDSLHESLGSLRGELDRIEHELQECAKTKGVKRLFRRKGLLKKIKRCESELADALQNFQTALISNMEKMRFTQIARRRRWKNMFDFIRRLWKGGKRSDG